MLSIGIIEFNSIAKGIEASDIMMKAGEVELLRANSICPGKFISMISGDVSAVESSVEAGVEIGKETVVNSLVISRIHPEVLRAVSGTTEITEFGALGVLEYYDVTTAINGADAAVKAANVSLIEIRLGFAIGGKSFVTLTRDVGAVNEAVKVGSDLGKEMGILVYSTVIPSPRKELYEKLL